MDWKPFFGKLASGLLKGVLYVFGALAALALTVGVTVFMLWLGQEDAVDDRNMGAMILGLVTFVGCTVAYVLWYVPMIHAKEYFAGWKSRREPPQTAEGIATAAARRRSILYGIGGFAVPTAAVFIGGGSELAVHYIGRLGQGSYAALIATFILGCFYLFSYVPAVRSGSISIPEKPRQAPPLDEYFVVEQRNERGPTGTVRMKRPTTKANRRQPDGSITYSFDSEDCNEWFE